MPRDIRSELQQEIVAALVETKAVDFGAAGKVLTEYGEKAALEGTSLSFVLRPRYFDVCFPIDDIAIVQPGVDGPGLELPQA